MRALQGGAARFGGEEFAAALPATDAEEARYVADQFPDPVATDRTPDIVVRVRWTEGGFTELTPVAVFPRWPAEAVWTAEAALELARDSSELAKGAGAVEQARQIQERLQLYQMRRPYRE